MRKPFLPVSNLFLIFFTLASAQASGSTSLFCKNPYQAVCDSEKRAKAISSQREKSGEALRLKYVYQAEAETERWLGGPLNWETPQDVQGMRKQEEARFYLASRLSGHIRAELSPLEESVVRGNFSKIREAVIGAVLGRVQKISLIAEMVTRVLAVQIFTYRDQLELEARSPSEARDTLEAFITHCGESGLRDGAFAKTLRGQSWVFVCPGMLVASIGRDPDPVRAFPKLLGVLAHEIAHHIDSGRLPKIYRSLKTCLANGSFEGLSRDEGETNERVISSRLTEITADYWAAAAVAGYLGQHPQALREMYEPVCGSADDGVHPSDRYRISVLLAGDPEIRKSLGCPVEDSIDCSQALP